MTATRTWLFAIAAAAVALIAFGSAATTRASGITTPASVDVVGESLTNNCGVPGIIVVPDSGPSFDFSQACANHDACYAEHHGEGEAARAACDSAFLNDMTSSCDDEWSRSSPRFDQCLKVAKLYYTAVRLGGWLFFYGPTG